MATIIVGHKGVDADCAITMLALRTALREIAGFKGEIRFAFVPQGTTFKGIKVDPKNQYEQLKGDRIYHIDCGRGYFDHHRSGCTAPSSAVLVDLAFRLSERLPEWSRLIKWATEAEQGRIKSGCALPAIIRGLHRQLGPGHDMEILRFAGHMIQALLANERVRVAGSKVKVKIRTVSSFLPLPDDEIVLRATKIDGFGNVGLIVGPPRLLGTFRNRLEREAHCRLIISFNAEGKVGILSCFPDSGEPVDLRELGIIQAIRAAEAKARGIKKLSPAELSTTGDVRGMKWFAHGVADGRVANLFNGSEKVDLTEEGKTRLSPDRIISIVKDQITMSVE